MATWYWSADTLFYMEARTDVRTYLRTDGQWRDNQIVFLARWVEAMGPRSFAFGVKELCPDYNVERRNVTCSLVF